MTLIQESDRLQITKMLSAMEKPVKLVNFTQTFECDTCEDTRQLLGELSTTSDKLSFEVYNFTLEKDRAAQYGVDKIPASVLVGEKDYGIRYYGIPAGFEFASLLEDLLMVSKGDSGLSQSTREKLATLKKPVHLQVLVTPTCPYCPGAVKLAHQFALESDLITADMVEVSEFPHLVQRYRVSGVPKTIINETNSAEGRVGEEALLEAVLAAASDGTEPS